MHPADDITDDERAVETLLATYRAHVGTLGVSDADAAALERLVHEPPPPRVLALVPIAGATENEPTHLVEPGAGLAQLLPADRAELLRLTRAHYDTPRQGVDAALCALYDRTRAGPAAVQATRTAHGWAQVPTWTEWAAAAGQHARAVAYGRAVLTGGWSGALRSGVVAHDMTFTLYRPELVALALELYDARHGKQRAPLRTGTAYLATITHTKRQVEKSRRQHMAGLSEQELEALKLFKYEPLGWAERLVLTALSNRALAEHKLEGHPAALATLPLEDVPLPRVRVTFHGYADLARWAGATPRHDGRIAKDVKRTLERALTSLTHTPRWIAAPVLVRTGKSGALEKRVRVSQALWIEATQLSTGETHLDLHPAAVGSLHRSFVYRGALYEQYDAARRAIGAAQMRNEWGYLEDYLLRLAGVKAGNERLAATPAGIPEGARTITAKIARATLWETLELDTVAKKRGKRAALEREAQAFAFCRATGSVLDVVESAGQADTVLVVRMPHPDVGHSDPNQFSLLAAPQATSTAP
jgi:hypothetical protein